MSDADDSGQPITKGELVELLGKHREETARAIRPPPKRLAEWIRLIVAAAGAAALIVGAMWILLDTRLQTDEEAEEQKIELQQDHGILHKRISKNGDALADLRDRVIEAHGR